MDIKRHRTNPLVYLLIFIAISVLTIAVLLWLKQSDSSDLANTPASYTITEAYVPVTTFNDPRNNITSAEFEALKSGTSDSGLKLININDLTPDQKLLSVDDQYFLDDFANGADIRTYQSETPPSSAPPTTSNTFSFAQTGVTAITRAMTTKLNQVDNGAYFAENIADFLSSKDLTHLSNEVSFADNCPGGSGTTTLCADWRALDTISAVGADLIELTGNHNNDYGANNNLKTIAKYHELGLQTFGGGANESEAAASLLLGVPDPANPSDSNINTKGTKITLLGYNNSTSTKENGQGASEDHPGANIYNEEHAKVDIEAAKANDSFVIVDVQFFECYCYPEEGQEMPSCDAPITNQAEFFKHLIDLGADMVVGTQAHQPQTYELYNGKPIFYGLGNLFFDQTYWPGTTRSLILTHYFIDGKYVQTRVTPTVYDASFQTRLMTEEESAAFLTRLQQSLQ